MGFDSIADLVVQCGGYAAICFLLIRNSEKQIAAHRDEVSSLGEVIRQNTAAISALTGRIPGTTVPQE